MPPSFSISAIVVSNTSATPGSMPSWPASSGGTPKRSPSSDSALGSLISSGCSSDVESHGSRPIMWR